MKTLFSLFSLFTFVCSSLVMFVVSLSLIAQQVQPPEVEWQKTFGGSFYDGANSVQQTTDGGYIVAGVTSSFGAGLSDVYLIKLNSEGNLDPAWQVNPKTFGGSSWDQASSVQQTKDGGYIVAGATLSFGVGIWDVYLIKTNASGDLLWQQTYGGAQSDWASSVQQTTDGGYIVAGGTYSFGAGESDVYLIKLDSLGNPDPAWQVNPKTFGGSSRDQASSVQQTTDGGYIVAGGTYSFGAGGNNVYLIKLDPQGNLDSSWQVNPKTFGGNSRAWASSVQQTTDGGYIVAGGIGFFFAGTRDFYLVKTDGLGNLVWQKTYGGTNDDWGNSVQQTTDGGYIVAGETRSFGAGDADVYLIKLNSEGNLDPAWKKNPKTFGGSGLLDLARSVQQTTDGGYIVAGTTRFFGTDTENGDVYVIKLKPEASFIDCNKNGITDAQDIFSGTSKDCNANKIPDECDIAQATSQDKNNNGIPDECEIPNQPPQITHTPITSAIQDKNIKVEFEAKDPDGVVSSVELFYRVTGVVDYQNIGMSPAQNQTQFTLEIPANAVTLAGVDYYIEAKDTEGATKTTPVYHVNVIDKWPVIIIPGVMGSELLDSETNEVIWLDKKILSVDDPWLLKLLLANDGISTDTAKRCSRDPTIICSSAIECPWYPPLITSCMSGRPVYASKPLMFDLGIYTYDAYNKLVEFLTKDENGYVLNTNLFTFPYDWRLDVVGRAELLKDKIDEVCASTKSPKVNVIAHSLGGLLTQTYIQKNLGENKINSVIFLGTPHLGSLSAYAMLKKYKPILNIFRKSLPFDMNWWLELDTQAFVCQNFPSIYEVLPVFDFITNNGVYEPYLESYEKNLKNNNSLLLEKAAVFQGLINASYPDTITYYNICGTAHATLLGFQRKNGKCTGLLVDFYGDGTVATQSAKALGNKNFYVDEEHPALPGNPYVHNKILAILQGDPDKSVDGISLAAYKKEIIEQGIAKKIKLSNITKCCPINLKIIDSSGNITGKDASGKITEQIADSDFYQFEENDAVYLPYEDIYTFEITGTGSGEFTITVDTLEDNDIVTETIEFKNVPVTEGSKGVFILAPENPNPELSYDVNGDDTNDFVFTPEQGAPEDLKNMFAQKGDANKDGAIDISDAISILSHLFLGGSIDCKNAGDVNSDKALDISDPIYLLESLFLGTREKPEGIVFCSL